MKTTSQKTGSGLKSRSAQLSSSSTPAQPEKKDNRLPIDTEARRKNRTLPTNKVLELLKTSNPGLFNLAEVVGKWVWVWALGISYGAVMALQWAAVDPRVQCVTAISPYWDPGTGMEEYLKTFEPELSASTDHKAAGLVVRQLAAKWPDLTTVSAVHGLKQPVLLVRGEQDELCRREDLSRLLAAAPNGSRFKEVPLANHLVTGICISQLKGTVTNWFGTHLAPLK